MPNYVAGAAIALPPGGQGTAFNAETPTAPQASQAFAVPPPFGSGQAQLSVQIAFASAPTAVVDVQGADLDADANYVSLATNSTNKQHDRLDISCNARFVRLYLASQSAGGAITAYVTRMG